MIQAKGSPRARAVQELRLFGYGLILGIAFVVTCFYLLGLSLLGITLFVWASVRVPYAIVIAGVVDLVMFPKEARAAHHFLPTTAFVAGAILPTTVVSLRYML